MISLSASLYNYEMPISARNKLRGTIEEIQLGGVMAHVVVKVGDNLIESVITRRSAEELKLKKGDTRVCNCEGHGSDDPKGLNLIGGSRFSMS
jgi:molybdopterin-binding protein